MQNLTVVYHIASMGNWKEVVLDQLSLLQEVGINEVRVTHVGYELEWIEWAFKRFGITLHIVKSDPNTDHYETFAMIEIERLARESELPILYLHTKGVSNPGCQEKWLWRKAMEDHLIRNWKENLKALDDYDIVGVNWISRERPHFSGNFWMARASWIRKLGSFIRFHHFQKLVRY